MSPKEEMLGWFDGLDGLVATECREDVAGDGFCTVKRRDGRGGLRAPRGSIYSTDTAWLAIVGPARLDGDRGRLRNGEPTFGTEFLQRYGDRKAVAIGSLSGHFSLALVDLVDKTVHLAVDRAGVGTLYYRRDDGELQFGTRLDDIIGFEDSRPALSPTALHSLLAFWCIPSPGTIFRDYRRVPAGTCVSLRERGASHTFYGARQYGIVNGHAGLGEIRACIGDAIDEALRLEADHEIGAFLSGGLDSSTVAGLAAARRKKPLPAFTITFSEKRYDESGYAATAAERFDLLHKTVELTPDFAHDGLRVLMGSLDEPITNTSIIGCYACALAAKESGVEVLLAGDGGDELFGGNERYAKDLDVERRRSLYGAIWSFWRTTGLKYVTEQVIPKKADRLAARMEHLTTPLPERLLLSVYSRGKKANQIFDPDVAADVDMSDPEQLIRTLYGQPAKSAALIHRLLNIDMRLIVAEGDVRKVVGACAAAGLRARFPMLDDDVIDVAVGLSSDELVRDGCLRPAFKEAWSGFLPAKIIQKPKKGFGVPTLEWFRTHQGLRDLVFDCAQSARERHLFDKRFLDVAIEQFCRGREGRNESTIVIDICLLELWLQEKESSVARGGHSPRKMLEGEALSTLD